MPGPSGASMWRPGAPPIPACCRTETLIGMTVDGKARGLAPHAGAPEAGARSRWWPRRRRAPVGFASAGPNRDDMLPFAGEVQTLYVLPDWQNQGIGRLLLQGCFARLRRHGHRLGRRSGCWPRTRRGSSTSAWAASGRGSATSGSGARCCMKSAMAGASCEQRLRLQDPHPPSLRDGSPSPASKRGRGKVSPPHPGPLPPSGGEGGRGRAIPGGPGCFYSGFTAKRSLDERQT